MNLLRRPLSRIVTNPDQERLFDAADAGVPILMERNGRQYLVVAADRLDALAGLMASRDRTRLLMPHQLLEP